MPNITRNIIRYSSGFVRDHFKKRVENGLFDAKVMLGASIALDATQNIVDYVHIGKSKNIDESNKKYLQAYKITNALIETAVQLGAGALIINERTQNYLINLSHKLTGLPSQKYLNNPIIRNNFRILTVLVGCVVLAKRVIAPILVTPLTVDVREQLEKNKKYNPFQNKNALNELLLTIQPNAIIPMSQTPKQSVRKQQEKNNPKMGELEHPATLITIKYKQYELKDKG